MLKACSKVYLPHAVRRLPPHITFHLMSAMHYEGKADAHCTCSGKLSCFYEDLWSVDGDNMKTHLCKLSPSFALPHMIDKKKRLMSKQRVLSIACLSIYSA